MADIVLNPPTGLRDVTQFPDDPGSSAAAREQIQSIIDQVVSQANTNLTKKESPAFTTVALANGWTGTIQYSKNDLGIVVLKVNCKGGTVTADTIVATLPAEIKPSERVGIPTLNMITGAALIGLVISTTGDIAVSFSANLATNQSIVGEVLYSTL